jgi:hypothetical protein
MSEAPTTGLAGLSPRRLRAVARRSDRLRRRDPAKLDRMASALQVPVRQLRMLADAWAAGRASGVAALGPAPADTDERPLADAAAEIDEWRARHFPLDVFEVEIWRNRLTVWHVRAADDRQAAPTRRPLLQLRCTGGQWHLYRRAAQGEWWPVVVPGRRPRSARECLDAVRVDIGNQFWAGTTRAEQGHDPWFSSDG